MSIRVDVGGTEGSMERPMLALFEESTLIASTSFTGSGSDIGLSYDNLDPAKEYYIAVDNQSGYYTYQGTFTLTVTDELTHDYKSAAIELVLDANDNYTSADAEFTNLIGTPDGARPAGWFEGPEQNMWFEFTPPASGNVNILVDVGGSKGNMKRPNLAIYEENTLIATANYKGDDGDIGLSAKLDPTKTHYISVDSPNDHYSYPGSFTLSVKEGLTHDFREAAIGLTLDANGDFCSVPAEYTTMIGSPDGVQPTNWPEAPHQNVWFYFDVAAAGTANVDVKVGGAEGTMLRPMLALFDSNLNEIASEQWDGNGADIGLQRVFLMPGRYFVSVDNSASHSSYQGSFTLCVDIETTFVLNDELAKAIDISSLMENCSSGQTFTNLNAATDTPAAFSSVVRNVWFSFKAPDNGEVTIRMSNQNMGRGTMVLLNDQMQLVKAHQNYYGFPEPEMSVVDLDPGATYYLTIGNPWHNWSGSDFDLCLEPKANYDYLAGAKNIDHLMNAACSTNGTFSNREATNDTSEGGPLLYKNVWFTLTATETEALTIRMTNQNMGRGTMVLFDSDTNVVMATGNFYNHPEWEMSLIGLNEGEKYFLSIGTGGPTWGTSTFDLCITDQPSNDNKEGALPIDYLFDDCSGPAEFNNNYAFQTGPTVVNYDVWFTFKAPTDGILTMRAFTGNDNGNMNAGRMRLMDAGENVIATVDAIDRVMEISEVLTPNADYYLVVGNSTWAGNIRGSFTLCLERQSTFNNKAGAIAITSLLADCSTVPEYTTQRATTDDFEHTPLDNNVWFSFVAPASESVDITVSRTGADPISDGRVVLLTEDASTLLYSQDIGNNPEVTINATGLTEELTYYISVGSRAPNGVFKGSFKICVVDADPPAVTELWAIKTGAWDDPATWSTTEGGVSNGAIPTGVTTVYIKGHEVTFNNDGPASIIWKRVVLSGISGAPTTFEVQSGELHITESIDVSGVGAKFKAAAGAIVRVIQ